MSFPYKIVVNLYIAYELDTWPKKINTDFTLVHCLSGAVKLTKNTDPGKYEYGGYGIGFNACWHFSWSNSSLVKNIVIFGTDFNSSMHLNNKDKEILVPCEIPTKTWMIPQ